MTYDPGSGVTSREDFAIIFVVLVFRCSSALTSVSVTPLGLVGRLVVTAPCRHSRVELPRLGCPRATLCPPLHLLLQNQHFLFIVYLKYVKKIYL